MTTPRTQCLVTVLPHNELIIMGGQTPDGVTDSIEIANIVGQRVSALCYVHIIMYNCFTFLCRPQLTILIFGQYHKVPVYIIHYLGTHCDPESMVGGAPTVFEQSHKSLPYHLQCMYHNTAQPSPLK